MRTSTLTDSPKANRAPQRVRNELRFRQLTVTAKTNVADSFWRIEFSGEDLAGFISPGFDDHIKVFSPMPAAVRYIYRK